MKITDFVISGQNVNICVDGEFWGNIPYLIVFDFRLHKGDEIESSLLDNLKEKADEQFAFEYAIKYLSRYSTTTKKMIQKLYEKEYSKSVVDNVITKLIDLKYLDDFVFAENLVARKSATLGKHRLKSELYSKGISSEIIDEVLNNLDNDEVYDTAIKVANKWFRSHSFQSMEDNQKFLRFMAYRGFDYDTINKCREVLKFGENNW